MNIYTIYAHICIFKKEYCDLLSYMSMKQKITMQES